MNKESLFQWNELEPLCIIRLMLRKLWLIILAALTAMMLVSLVLTNLITTQYTCSVTFAVTSRSGSVSPYANTTAASEVAEIYAQLLTGRLTSTVLQSVLGSDYNAQLSAAQQGGTNLLLVTATSDSPRDALAVIQTVINQQSDLSSYVSDNAILNVLNTPIISRVSSQVDNHKALCLLAGMGGAAATMLALFFLSVNSGTIQTRTAAKHNLDASVLVSIPHETAPVRHRRKKDAGAIRITEPLTSFSYTESIHRLALELEQENSCGKCVFLFTSVSESEGKSTVAANTALSLASKGAPVLLIDLDLRRPVQYRMVNLAVPSGNDLGRLLSANAGAREILDAAIRRPNSTLDTLLTTRSSPQLVEQLSSTVLQELLRLARQRYRYIILDTPPLGYFSDSEILSDLSDASVLVVRQDTVPADAINDAIDALNASRGQCLGVVLNDMAYWSRRSAYGYGYGYGKYGHYGKYAYGKYGKYDHGKERSGASQHNE